MKPRVVITGLGVIAPNAHGVEAYESALKNGKSGIRFRPEMEAHKFSCQVAGVPENVDQICLRYFNSEQLMAMNSNIRFASIAAIDAWKDAGFEIPSETAATVDWDTGAMIGTGIGGMDTIGEKLIPLTNEGKVRRLGSTMVEQVMASGISARVGGLLALGNQVTTNSSACSTGTEAVADAFYRIRHGLAKRMLAGGSEGASFYSWAGFDAMRVLNKNHNHVPEKASRPMSASAGGFVPGSGAGVLMLESLDSAMERKARIYAEIAGAAVTCGGHRMGGSMTAPNPFGVKRCVQKALAEAGIQADEVDAINGHLTATFADPHEIKSWAEALVVPVERFPKINSTKSLIGHALGAAGGLELVACALEVSRGFIHGSLNCEDVHPEIMPYERSIVRETVNFPALRYLAKASFGFGDVNACILLKKWENN